MWRRNRLTELSRECAVRSHYTASARRVFGDDILSLHVGTPRNLLANQLQWIGEIIKILAEDAHELKQLLYAKLALAGLDVRKDLSALQAELFRKSILTY